MLARLAAFRLTPRAYAHLTRLAVAAVALIIVTGAAVRLTDSGLGCSDWPNCSEGRFVGEMQFHTQVEQVNRFFTGAVSLAVIVAVIGSLVRIPKRRDLVWLSLGLVAGVLGQIVLGGLVVLFELKPPFVMGHFLLSIVLLGDALVLHHRAERDDAVDEAVVEPRLRRFAWAAFAVTCVALFTGTVVTATGPHGGDELAERFSWPLPDVARVHGSVVMALVATVVTLLVVARRTGAAARFVHRVQVLLGALVLQALIGYVQYFSGVPALLVGFHVAGAVLVFSAAVHVVLATRAPVAAPHPVPEPRPGAPAYA
jgi:cytochrome c oxidase assembly protein subunit 15